jgi:adenine/guanine phosphoribosyltransferase-like PRPP-binding protein
VTVEELGRAIRNVPDFPQAGIQFKDITPVWPMRAFLPASIDHLTGSFQARHGGCGGGH